MHQSSSYFVCFVKKPVLSKKRLQQETFKEKNCFRRVSENFFFLPDEERSEGEDYAIDFSGIKMEHSS